jgi:hypothetical protein
MTNSRTGPWLCATVAVGVLLALPSNGSAQALELRAGRWAVSMVQGVNEQPGTTIKDEACLTAEDLRQFRDLRHFLTTSASAGAEEEQCKVEDYRSEAGRVTFTLQCAEGPDRTTIRAEATVAAEHYQLVTHTVVEGMRVRIERTGRRIGAC